jgi:hypothetical protein
MNISHKLSGNLVVSTNSQLLFSTDSKHFLPLAEMAALQAPAQASQFIVRYFETPVAFEHGATLSNFLLALEPWKDLLSLYTDRDVGAYIVACRRPVGVTEPQDDPLTKIVVSSITDIRRHILRHREKQLSEYDDIEEYFNAPVTREPTPLLTVEHVVRASGFVDNDPDTSYSLMGDFNDIRNLPIELETKSRVQSVDDEPLLNPAALGASATYEGKCVGFDVEIQNPLTLREVVHAVVVSGLFFQTPQGMERFNEKLKEDIKNDPAPHLSVVGEDPTPTIHIKDGAFDDMFASIEHETNVWDELLKQSKHVRIGVKKP